MNGIQFFQIIKKTDKAIYTDIGWLAKSQIRVFKLNNGSFVATMPKWMINKTDCPKTQLATIDENTGKVYLMFGELQTIAEPKL